MNRLLPSLWLLGAALYAAATLLLTQPFLDGGSASLAAAHETVVAKQVPSLVAEPVSPELPVSAPAPATEQDLVEPPAEAIKPHNEWVAIVGYTAVVRAEPSLSAPVLTAYAVGHGLRVIERKGGFARVQDLSSGQLGWVATSSIGAFLPGYREREAPLVPPTLVAVRQTNVVPPRVTQAKVIQPSPSPNAAVAAAPRAKREAVAVSEPSDPPLVTRASLRPQRVADNQADGGVASLVQRAFSGY